MIHKEVILVLMDVGKSMYEPHPNSTTTRLFLQILLKY